MTMEEDAERAQRRPLQPSAEDEFARQRRLRRRERGPGAWPPGSGSAPTDWSCRSACSSGGERRRVELARILFAGSDVLLLDEPTNHLDIDAKMWLLQFLRAYRGALLVISHDLDLLDEAITRVLHLDRPAEEAVGDTRRVQGHLQPVPDGSRRPTRSAWPRRRCCRPRRSPDCRRVVDRFGAKATQGGDGAQQGEAHRPARGAAACTSARATARCG